MKIFLTIGLIKRFFFFLKKKSNLFSQTLKKTNNNKIEIDLDLYIYATKTDSKNAAGVDTLHFA